MAFDKWLRHYTLRSLGAAQLVEVMIVVLMDFVTRS